MLAFFYSSVIKVLMGGWGRVLLLQSKFYPGGFGRISQKGTVSLPKCFLPANPTKLYSLSAS